MRDYSRFSSTFWTRGTGKELRGDHLAQAIAAYLFTAPSANMIGLYYLPISTIAHDVGSPIEGASKVLRDLARRGFCEYSEASETVFVRSMAPRQLGLADGETIAAGDKRLGSIPKMMRECSDPAMLQAFWDEHHDRLRLPEPWWDKPLRSPFEAPPEDLARGSCVRARNASRDQAQEQAQEQAQKIPPGGAGAPDPGLEPEDPEPILTQDPPPPPRRQRVNGKQLPMKPAAPKALCWKLWRDMYSRSRRGYGKYVENPASAKAIEALAERALSEAISELTDRGQPGANPEPLVEEILRHWFASFLRDDGFNDFLATKRHAVEYLLKSLSEYGLPKGWGEAAKRRAQESMAQIGVLDV